MRLLVYTLGSYGHVFPVIPLVKAAEEAGHELRVVTEPSALETFARSGISAVGLDHGQLRHEEDSERMRRDAGLSFRDTARMAFHFFAAQGEQILPALEAQLRDFRPDVVLRDVVGFGALLAAERCGTPVTSFEWTPAPAAFWQRAVAPELDAIRQRCGLAPDPGMRNPDRWLRLVLAPPWWGPGAEGLPPTLHWIRPDPVEDAAGPAWLTRLADRTAVYATLGTVFNQTEGVFETLLEGLARLEDVAVIATVGPGADPAAFRGLPERIRVEPFVPQAAVLGVVQAVIAHGGYGSLMGAMRAGIPAVAIPLGAADNVINAQSVAARGAGLVVGPDERRPEVIAERVRRVLEEPAFREAARGAAREIAALPGPEHAVELLARVAESGPAVARAT